MAKNSPIIARINRFADANGILPATVVRKATGDSRGLARLLRKIEDIQKVEEWLDEQEASMLKKARDNRHLVQEAAAK